MSKEKPKRAPAVGELSTTVASNSPARRNSKLSEFPCFDEDISNGTASVI